MSTYLLTWNPNRFQWAIEEVLATMKRHGYADLSWSCGNTKRIRPGDRVFLLRQGKEPRGIIASGVAQSIVKEERRSWNDFKLARYIDVRLDSLLDPEAEGVLPSVTLQEGDLGRVNWRTQASGILVEPIAAGELERLWRLLLEQVGQSPLVLADEIPESDVYFEGARRSVTVNAYERDPRARRACLDHYGTACSVCGFDFRLMYGAIGDGFIHVHHLVPLHEIGQEYVIDPVRDLRPVCPNCHSMLHRGDVLRSIDELRAIIATPRGSAS